MNRYSELKQGREEDELMQLYKISLKYNMACCGFFTVMICVIGLVFGLIFGELG
jgi:hypothetical protein